MQKSDVPELAHHFSCLYFVTNFKKNAKTLAHIKNSHYLCNAKTMVP